MAKSSEERGQPKYRVPEISMCFVAIKNGPPARWSSRTAKPVMRWPEKDAAWQDVALGIREVVKWRKPDLKAEPFFGRIAT